MKIILQTGIWDWAFVREHNGVNLLIFALFLLKRLLLFRVES